MAKHIGIVGVSAEGAALCYRTLCVEGGVVMGRHSHPEVTMHTYPLSQYMKFIEKGDWNGVAQLMISSASKLAMAGADLLISPDNTIHQAFDLVEENTTIPWLHIAEEVVKEANRKHYQTLGFLGTIYTMEGPVYADKISAAGLKYIIPEEKEREQINKIIFDELVNGLFNAKSRSYYQNIINQLKDKGCDAVILGCTEIPLLISKKDSSLPVLDSTRLLARAALRKALN